MQWAQDIPNLLPAMVDSTRIRTSSLHHGAEDQKYCTVPVTGNTTVSPHWDETVTFHTIIIFKNTLHDILGRVVDIDKNKKDTTYVFC